MFIKLRQLIECLFFLFAYGKLPAQLRETLTIHFAFDKASIDSTAARDLGSFIKTNLQEYVIDEIELDGHCDHIGSHNYNDKLSWNRVEAVKRFLLESGLPPIIPIKLTAHGKRVPLNNNENDQERYLNRRVTITLSKHAMPVSSDNKTGQHVPTPERSLSEIITDSATTIGSRIILRNLNFYGGRHILLPESIPILEELGMIMKENPSISIEIHGHVCCSPPTADGHDIDTRTNDLSVQRARLVYRYLIDIGIDKSRLSYKGFGGRFRLFPDEKNEEEKAANRRVEIKIVTK